MGSQLKNPVTFQVINSVSQESLSVSARPYIITELSAEDAVELYRQRDHAENFIRELKNGFDLQHFPCQKLNGFQKEFGDAKGKLDLVIFPRPYEQEVKRCFRNIRLSLGYGLQVPRGKPP